VESGASLSCRLPCDSDSSKLGFQCGVVCLILDMNPHFSENNRVSIKIIKGGDLRPLTRLRVPVCQKVSVL
jgi:hypothetical protein